MVDRVLSFKSGPDDMDARRMRSLTTAAGVNRVRSFARVDHPISRIKTISRGDNMMYISPMARTKTKLNFEDEMPNLPRANFGYNNTENFMPDLEAQYSGDGGLVRGSSNVADNFRLECPTFLPCFIDTGETFGHHVSIFMVALVAFMTFFTVTLILILVFVL